MTWKQGTLCVVAGCVAAAAPRPAAAQFGRIGDSILKRAEQVNELRITDEEERRLGEAVSQKVRERYGVVQDKAVHRYVALVGTVLAQAGSRPGLDYRFIVLDTDGVNAFAAPGGYVHITRGALGLIRTEAELAGVLAHELVHVTSKHTIKAIQKGKFIRMAAEETLSANDALFAQLVDRTTELVMAGFGRAEELESDQVGIRVANKVGYDPKGLAAVLARIDERNQGRSEKQGLWASHPEMAERLQRIARQVTAEKLNASATLADRYARFISYEAKAQVDIPVVDSGAAGLTGGGAAKSDAAAKTGDKPAPKKKGFGIGSLLRPGGEEKKSAEVTGSAASRGVDRERNAVGGPVKTAVVVQVTAEDLAAFKKEGRLR
ncbi:MAG: M48 family metalloprotease [Vicinamibacterales bacterium]